MLKTYIDLCCGTGGFGVALEQSGLECVFANDMEKSSEVIYCHNNPGHPFTLANLHDIASEDIPPHDILCAGFPCQPFSIAGKCLGFDGDILSRETKLYLIVR